MPTNSRNVRTAFDYGTKTNILATFLSSDILHHQHLSEPKCAKTKTKHLVKPKIVDRKIGNMSHYYDTAVGAYLIAHCGDDMTAFLVILAHWLNN